MLAGCSDSSDGSEDDLTGRNVAADYAVIRAHAVLIAGKPEDAPTRATFLHDLYDVSQGRHAFPEVALHGALWGARFLARTQEVTEWVSEFGFTNFDAVQELVTAAERFGHVSHLTPPDMLALSAARGGDPQRPGKRNPVDPLLWQAPRAGEPSWDSSAGPGRPGWHIECAAIALAELGPGFDVQGGGSDLIFPHHEMSAAQGEVLDGWPFARSYIHAPMVSLDGEKMSKSLGNLVFVSALRSADVDPMAIRLALLGQWYREDWSWSDALLASAAERLQRWRAALSRPTGPPSQRTVEALVAGVADDLNTPVALAAVDQWVQEQHLRGGDDLAGPGLLSRAIDGFLGVI